MYLPVTTAPTFSFLALVAVTALVLALVFAFALALACVAGHLVLAFLALAAIIDSTDFHRDRPLERAQAWRNLIHVSTVSAHRRGVKRSIDFTPSSA